MYASKLTEAVSSTAVLVVQNGRRVLSEGRGLVVVEVSDRCG